MTPRRAQAWLYHATVQHNKEMAALMNIIYAGAQGRGKDIKKIAKEMTSDVL